MTRLALAKTIVSGTVTLQGMGYSFTASSSGKATADKVPEAKKLAVAASNTAAISAARIAIDKILSDNSAVLSDLEITSLISNNLSTTVVVFKPIALSKIASSSNGVNYTLNQNVTIGSNQWLTVPSGKTLTSTADNPLINNGYVQLGDGTQTSSGALKKSASCTNCTDIAIQNSETVEFNKGTCCTVYGHYNTGTFIVHEGACCIFSKDYTFNNSSNFSNYGTTTNDGTFTNSGISYSNIYNGSGSFTNSKGATIINSGYGAAFRNVCGAYFVNDGTVDNSGENSYSCIPTSGSGSCSGDCSVACVQLPPPPQ